MGTVSSGQHAMTRAAPSRGPAGAVPGRTSWPVRSGTVPTVADGYSDRLETAPDLAAALPAGAAVALVPDRAAGPGPAPGPAAPDWLRSSGKTQLAAAFAESLWRSRALDLLVWIQATSRTAVLSGYAAATAAVTGRDRASSCESVAAQFASWLSETSRSWLVVLDDLADPADLDGLWPGGRAGRLLVTCADAAAVPGGMRVLPVGLFNSREALSHLMGRLSANPGQRLGAMDLASAVGVEPVALTQASAVIASSTTMSCHHYREYFLRRREQLTASPEAPPPASAVTWTLSFERASQLAPAGFAQSLLAVAAFLDGHGIPATVLTAPAAVGHPDDGDARLSIEPARAALAALERVGLLTVEPVTAPPTVRISPVLQAALRATMPEGMLDRTARFAADAVLQAWPEPEQPGWPASVLRSCTAALRQNAGDRLWAGDGCHPVLIRAGDSLDHARLTGPAVDYWRDLLEPSERLLGAGHPDTVLIGRRLADACLAAGRAGDAATWFQRLLDILGVEFGPEHQDVIGARLRLGHALTEARQLDDAISVLDDVRFDAEEILGPDHADTLAARDELAAAYLAAGHHSDAITAYRRALTDRERIQGARHPETMTTRQGLADSLLADGRAKEAVAAYKRVVADRERALGPDHLDTTRARYGLGAAYQRTGKTVAAERAYEQARSGFEQALGPRHPDTLRSRAELALVYGRLGRYGDARALLRDTVDRLERILPHDDPLITELREVLVDIGDE